MDQQINLLLTYGAIGLAGIVLFKLLTRTEVQPVSYTPFIGYADDKNNMLQPGGVLAQGAVDTLRGTDNGGKIYQIGENTYQYVD